MANVYVAATATWNGKALKKASKDITSFEKNVKKLGRTLGLSLGTAAIVNYGKKAVNAFAKDEAAAKSLEQQLKNTGYAFSSPDVEYYIANLQKMTGVLDDQLRPAFQTLLTASGSLTKSQKALALALDIAAGTGKSVEEVSMALAKGYAGQTTALARLGAGISKTTLATGDMNKIMDELQYKFSGQAKARLETYAGKMDQLKVASANASEAIGKGILNALSSIGKDKNLESITKGMESLGVQIGNVIAGLGVMLGKFTSLAQNSGFLKLLSLSVEYSIPGLLSKALASAGQKANAPSSNFTYSLGSGAGTEIAKLQELKARKALIVQLKAEEALKKLKDKYDVERIGLMAALNAATDEETKLRLAEKLAILDGNAAMAAKYLAERDATQNLEELAEAADAAKSAFARLAQWNPLSGLMVTQSDLAKTGVSRSTNAGLTPYDPLSSLIASPSSVPPASSWNPLSGLRPTQQDINVYVDATSMVDSANMTRVVQQAFLEINKNGYSTVPAGQGF